MDKIKLQKVTITNPMDRLLYREILLFALKSPKRRHGFDAKDCLLYLITKGVKIEISVVQHALSLMVTASILEEVYSSERNRTIYRLR